MRLSGTAYVYMIVLVIMLVVIVSSLLMEFFESKLIPLLVGSTVFILTAVALGKEIVTSGKQDAAATESEQGNDEEAREGLGGYLVHGAWVGGFVFGIYLLGFVVAIPLFVLSYTKYLGTRWLTAIICAVVTTALVYGVFGLALEVDLYRGLLFS